MSQHLIVGYGTLLYRESLGDSIGKGAAQSKRIRPVRVAGFKRLFNLRPTHYSSSQQLTDRGIENAAMNVEPAADATFNGLAFEVSSEELSVLDERERYYQRLPASLYDFEHGEQIGEGFLYSSQPEASWIDRDPARLLPLWRDILWGRAGAYGFGRTFGEFFDQTTFLADGETLVIERYRYLLEDSPTQQAREFREST